MALGRCPGLVCFALSGPILRKTYPRDLCIKMSAGAGERGKDTQRQGLWTDYGGEICRQAEDVVAYDY